MKIIKIFILLVFVNFISEHDTKAQLKLSPFISYGAQSLKYSFDNADVKGSTGIGFGADIQYHLSEYLIVGTGLRIHSYKATAELGDFYTEQDLVDMDGDSYILRTTGSTIEEEYKSTAIEIPLFIRYQKWVTSDMILYGATGPVFSFLGSPNVSMNGTISTEGYYPEWELTIDNVEEYGFYTRDINDSKTETTLKTSIGWLIEVGAEYYLSKRVNLTAGVFFQPGLSNLSNGNSENEIMLDSHTYNGTLNGTDKVKLSKVGLRLGINFDLTPNYRSSVKSIR